MFGEIEMKKYHKITSRELRMAERRDDIDRYVRQVMPHHLLPYLTLAEKEQLFSLQESLVEKARGLEKEYGVIFRKEQKEKLQTALGLIAFKTWNSGRALTIEEMLGGSGIILVNKYPYNMSLNTETRDTPVSEKSFYVFMKKEGNFTAEDKAYIKPQKDPLQHLTTKNDLDLTKKYYREWIRCVLYAHFDCSDKPKPNISFEMEDRYYITSPSLMEIIANISGEYAVQEYGILNLEQVEKIKEEISMN